MKIQKGFTLLELLVSLALFAVIYMVAHGTLASILSGSRVLSAEQKRWQGMDIAFTLMQEDLRFASGRAIRDESGFTQPAMSGQQTDSRALAPPTLEFSRAGLRVLSGEAETGDRRVGYRLKDGALYRELWSSMDRKFDTQPTSSRLLTDVDQFEVRFLNRDGHWLPSWPDNEHKEQALPVAVELNIETKDGTAIKRLFLVNG